MLKSCRRRWLLTIAAAQFVVLTIVFVTVDQLWYPAMGGLRGEPFFDGMPASYWGARVRCHVIQRDPNWQPGLARFLAVFSTNAAATYRAWTESVIEDQIRWLADPAAIPVVRALLKDRDSDVRRAAIAFLYSQNASSALPELLPLLTDPDTECRRTAAAVIGASCPEHAAAACSVLIEMLSSPDLRVARVGAYELAAMIGRKREPAFRA
jgi:hypothetical protein